MKIKILLTWCVVVAGLAPALIGSEPTAEQVTFFEKKIRPILVERCQECHGADVQEGKLRVDSPAALLAGGERGPAVVPGKAKESLLIRAVGHGETLQMPPKKKLSAAQILELTQWVNEGAVWPHNATPATATAGPARPAEFSEKQTGHWAFQPLGEPPVPNAGGAASAIDAFLDARMSAAKLVLAPPADARTLLRRVTYDLTGLPPTPEAIQAYLADDSPDAYDRLIDRLLASPRYGEKHGRQWLDLARYADSNGLDENLAYGNAFRYRDYVIAAFNHDKPYDRFVQEQLAGDLLTVNDPAERIAGITATGFLSLGAKMLAEDDPVKMQMDIIDEQIDTLGKCVLGLTLGCARCHDHKYDPVDLADYYSLAGIFKSTKTMENHGVVAVWQERSIATDELTARVETVKRQVAQRKAEAARVSDEAFEATASAERLRAGEYLWAAYVRTARDAAAAAATKWGEKTRDERAAAEGLLEVEAENYDRGNVLKDTTNYGVGIGVLVNEGKLPNFVEYDLTTARAGVYQLEMRYAAADARPVKITFNGESPRISVAGKKTGGWGPDRQTWFVEGFVELPAGKVTVRLEQPTAFPHIDRFILAPAKGVSPDIVRADDPTLHEEFIKQWCDLLRNRNEFGHELFVAWRVREENRPIESIAEGMNQRIAERLDLASASTPRVWAERYGRLFREAETAWRELRATAAGKDAKQLPDPLLERVRSWLHDPNRYFAKPKNVETVLPAEVRERLTQLKQETETLEKSSPILPTAMAVSEAKAENVRIHFRGNHLTLGPAVPRRFLRVLSPTEQTPIGEDRSGRLELARWLTRPDHPLTSRVMVNRIWQQHFGQGLVRSSDNFGLLGEAPSHPELLDHLARFFPEAGWSVKTLHRRVMTSAAYRRATGAPELADPENRLLAHFDRRRLQAEEIRDSILFVSGGLSLDMGGSRLTTENRKYVTSTASVNPSVYQHSCRSVYLPVIRSALYNVFQAFDFADPSVLIARRDSTTVAPQALFMLNSRITAEGSAALANGLLARAESTDAQRVELLFETTYGRPATEEETERALAFVERYSAAAAAGGVPADQVRAKAWQALCRGVLAANEFLYLD